jgi:hypothetical protein
MPPSPSLLALHALRALTRSSTFTHRLPTRHVRFLKPPPSTSTSSPLTRSSTHPFSTSTEYRTTLNQVRRQPRKPQPARRPISPAMTEHSRPSMKGVCLKVGITKPKKPNSGQRKVKLICSLPHPPSAVSHPYIPTSVSLEAHGVIWK